ncbi:GNAT family N-acetyltransferase [Arcanobacterium haemolyticum]|nr:GNAT family N-acetyltransferase [Arcanobacterium haemolyticum]
MSNETTRPARSLLWRVEVPAWFLPERSPNELLRVDTDHAVILLECIEGTMFGDEAGVAVDGAAPVRLISQGDPAAVCAELERRHSELPAPGWATLPEGTYDLASVELREWLGAHRGAQWEVYWTDHDLPTQPLQERVRFLGPDDGESVRSFLLRSNPVSEAFEQFDVYRWYGIHDDDGRLAAVVGAIDDGVGTHLSGLGTDPELRGRGFAGALMAGVVAAERARDDIVHFSMWSFNDRARRVYERIGFTFEARMETITPGPVRLKNWATGEMSEV